VVCSNATELPSPKGPAGTMLWPQPGPDDIKRTAGRRSARSGSLHIGLLIRGFGVRVPGGAQLIKALTCRNIADQSIFHVQCGRMGAPFVLCSPATVSAWPDTSRHDAPRRPATAARQRDKRAVAVTPSLLRPITVGLGSGPHLVAEPSVERLA
jgi:hypothetical protein